MVYNTTLLLQKTEKTADSDMKYFQIFKKVLKKKTLFDIMIYICDYTAPLYRIRVRRRSMGFAPLLEVGERNVR